jgi:basic membrane protein A and related proteins
LVISKRLLALGATAAIITAACGPGTATSGPAASQPAATQSTGSEPPSTSTGGDKGDYTACVAFDTGGLGDKNFNDLAKKGLDDAEAAGYTTKFAQAAGSSDYAANIARLVAEGCQTIVTVGFLQSAATAEATGLFPEVAFAQVDTAWNLAGPDFIPGNADDTPFPPNFTGLDYQIDQAAMLAGYLSAAYSETGKVATYGGLAFPGVTRFMDGFYAGVMYHNQEKATDVKVLGWDGSKDDPTDGGTFVGGSGGNDTWNDPGKGEVIANNFLNQDVDILHPVAGATGNGSIKAMFEAEKWAVGVDTDQYISLGKPTNGALLTSAQKAIDVSVLDVINKHFEGDMGGEDYVGTLANDGVLLAPFHDYEEEIAAIEGLTTEIEALRAAIVDGSVSVCDFLARC